MRAAAVCLSALVFVACGIPRDPEGTLDRATGGTITVGAIEAEPWVVVEGDEPRDGIEVELVERLAAAIDADVRWVIGSEEELLSALELGELDLVVGGLTATNPWSGKVTFTRPYVTRLEDVGLLEPATDPTETEHVFAIRHGENAWLSAIERFLDGQDVRALLEGAAA
jgi:polar amino acid transport system substrate-binding protein